MTTSRESQTTEAPFRSASGDAPSGQSRPAAGTQPRRAGARPRRPWGRRKVCQFCADHVEHIDFKAVSRIRRYVGEHGRIEPSKRTGTCARHQRMLRTAIVRARHMGLLPFSSEHIRTTGAVQPAAPSDGRSPESPTSDDTDDDADEAESAASTNDGFSEDSAEDSEAASADQEAQDATAGDESDEDGESEAEDEDVSQNDEPQDDDEEKSES